MKRFLDYRSNAPSEGMTAECCHKNRGKPQTVADMREAYERRGLYPRFIREAESEGNEDAVRAFP